LLGDDELVGGHFVATLLAIWKRREAEDAQTRRLQTLSFLCDLCDSAFKKHFVGVDLRLPVSEDLVCSIKQLAHQTYCDIRDKPDRRLSGLSLFDVGVSHAKLGLFFTVFQHVFVLFRPLRACATIRILKRFQNPLRTRKIVLACGALFVEPYLLHA